MADRGAPLEYERSTGLDASTGNDLEPIRSALRDDSLLIVGVDDRDEMAALEEPGIRLELVRATLDCKGRGSGWYCCTTCCRSTGFGSRGKV